MWQIGEVPEPYWIAQQRFTRQALHDERLGFADRYLFKKIDPDVAQAHRDHDAGRARPNFDLHLRLSGSLLLWYETLAEAMPGLVDWELPEILTSISDAMNPCRYDVSAFDRFIQMLPRPRR
ncbi:hypothetical protein ASE37_22210 [Rhizobium sp. Root268]|nr:hypothetical protein ASC86_23640 [Rhizobium sp. Root1212]KRD34980.1 hypothetical protein ASE37_22210 [Rhizobium sp. Root268]